MIFDMDFKQWISLSDKKQLQVIDHHVSRCYNDKDDCFVVRGINDRKQGKVKIGGE